MRLKPRLVPSLILVATIMLAFRIGLVWHDAGLAFAQAESKPEAAKPPAEAKSGGEGKPEVDTTVPPEPPRQKPAQHFTPAEIQVLQELSKRRAELDQRQQDIDQRELTLKAVEQRVDEKIAQLKQIQTQVDAMLGKSAAQDDDRIKSLVHIYENMKPKDAATIFEGMDMPALMQLLPRMKDLKTAPILAAMAPDKARAVTIAMAQRKELPEQKTTN